MGISPLSKTDAETHLSYEVAAERKQNPADLWIQIPKQAQHSPHEFHLHMHLNY